MATNPLLLSSDDEVFGITSHGNEAVGETPDHNKEQRSQSEPLPSRPTADEPTARSSARLRRRQSLRKGDSAAKGGSPPAGTMTSSSVSSGELQSTSGPSPRRYRRRRTVEKVHFSPEETSRARGADQASINYSTDDIDPQNALVFHSESVAPLSTSPSAVTDGDSGFYDNQQQQERRRRRELSSSRRRRSLSAITSVRSNEKDTPGPSSSQEYCSTSSGGRPGILRPPRRRRSIRNMVEVYTTTTTTREEITSTTETARGSIGTEGDS